MTRPAGLTAATTTTTAAAPRRRKRSQFDAVDLLTVYLALLILLPGRLVLAPLGAAGRPAIILGIGMFVLWLASRLLREEVLPGFQPLRWAVAVFAIGALVTYALGYARGLPGIESRGSDRLMLTFVALSAVLLTAADGIRTMERLHTLIHRLIWLACVTAVVGVLQFFRGINLAEYVRVPGLVLNAPLVGIGDRGGPGFARVAGLTGHFIEFGVVLSMVLPLAVHATLYASSKSMRLRLGLATALIGACIPLSISRAGMLSLVLGMGLLVLAWKPRLQAWAAGAGLIFLVGFQVVVPGLLGTIRAAFTNASNDPSILNRRSDYAVVGEYFRDRMMFGRGPGTFLPDRYLLLDNQYLLTAAEMGLFGGLALLFLLLTGALVARIGRRTCASERQRHLMHALSIVVFQALLVSGTFDSLTFGTFAGVLFLALGLIGAVFRLRHRDPNAVDTDPPTALRPLMPLRAPRPGAGVATAPRTA